MSEHALVGVAALVRRPSDGALLIHRRAGSHGAGTWSVPGGHVDVADKSIVDAALRELREESGIVAPGECARLLPHTTFTHFPERGAAYVTLYVAVDLPENVLTVGVSAEERDKCAEWCWLEVDEPWPGPVFAPLALLLGLGVDPWRDMSVCRCRTPLPSDLSTAPFLNWCRILLETPSRRRAMTPTTKVVLVGEHHFGSNPRAALFPRPAGRRRPEIDAYPALVIPHPSGQNDPSMGSRVRAEHTRGPS